MFANPAAVWATVRPPILGLDTRDGNGLGTISGMPYWNVDVSVKKNLHITERYSAEFQFNLLNVFNHKQFADPTLDISNSASWGVLSSQTNTPRQIQFGIRFRF
jgi:hypothetical protein